MEHKKPRDLLVTKDVQWFIEKCSLSELCQRLLKDIRDARIDQERDICIRVSQAQGFLLYMIDPENDNGPERVVVWHGPSDGGAFFKAKILERAAPYEIPMA